MKWNCLFLLALLALWGCTAPERECEECAEASREKKEVVQVNGDDLLKKKELPRSAIPEKEKRENHAKIVSKYGEQWDFCSCVLANDSINEASKKTMTEAETDRFMKRWEEIEFRCKEFLTSPNTTPDERVAHEKKVRKCLAAAARN